MTLIDNFLTGTYEVKRQTPGTYVLGMYQAGDPETIRVRGSLQPTNARELKMPEEGNRIRQLFKFYTDAPILTDSERTLAGSDRVTINGDTYRVLSVENWAGTAFPYFKSILSREPENQ